MKHFAFLSITLLLTSQSPAFAEHRERRSPAHVHEELDQHAHHVQSHVDVIMEAVRVGTRLDPRARYLQRESEDVYAASEHLHESINRGRSVEHLSRDIEELSEELCDLDRTLQRVVPTAGLSDRFCRDEQSRVLYSRSSIARCTDVGQLVRQVRLNIAQAEEDLDEMRIVLRPMPVHYHDVVQPTPRTVPRDIPRSVPFQRYESDRRLDAGEPVLRDDSARWRDRTAPGNRNDVQPPILLPEPAASRSWPRRLFSASTTVRW